MEDDRLPKAVFCDGIETHRGRGNPEGRWRDSANKDSEIMIRSVDRRCIVGTNQILLDY